MVTAKNKKKEESKPVVIVVNGDEFDSSKGIMSMGDMVALEELGIDFAALEKANEMPVSKVLGMASVCLKSSSGGEVKTDKEYMDKIPTTQFGEIVAFVLDYFTRNFPESAEDKKGS